MTLRKTVKFLSHATIYLFKELLLMLLYNKTDFVPCSLLSIPPTTKVVGFLERTSMVIKRIINVKHSPLYYEDYLVFVCIEAVHQTLIGERWKK